MATTSANESEIRDNYYTELNNKIKPKESFTRKDTSRDGYKPRENFNSREGFKPKENSNSREGFKPRENFGSREGFKPRDKFNTREGFKPRENSNSREGFKPRENSNPREGFKPRENSNPRETYKSRDNQDRNKSPFSYAKNKDFSRNNYLDKDEDNEKSVRRNQKGNDAKSKSISNKEKEQQPDKFDTIKRLEREKKAMQKKMREEELVEKQKRPPIKQRKSTRINWTKGYECGLLDEDEDYAEYM